MVPVYSLFVRGLLIRAHRALVALVVDLHDVRAPLPLDEDVALATASLVRGHVDVHGVVSVSRHERAGDGSGGDSAVPQIEEAALDQFHMADRGMTMLKEAVEEELEGADSFLAALKS